MKRILLLAATLFLFACNNSTKNSKTEVTGNEKNRSNDQPAGVASVIKVTLKGGPNEGTYTVTSAEPTCSMGLTGKNSFGNQYSVDGKKDNELSSVQMIINDADAAKNGTDKFMITISFGPLFQGKSYEIKENSGSGTATLSESGGTKTVTVNGKTKDGVGISATLTCNSVINGG